MNPGWDQQPDTTAFIASVFDLILSSSPLCMCECVCVCLLVFVCACDSRVDHSLHECVCVSNSAHCVLRLSPTLSFLSHTYIYSNTRTHCNPSKTIICQQLPQLLRLLWTHRTHLGNYASCNAGLTCQCTAQGQPGDWSSCDNSALTISKLICPWADCLHFLAIPASKFIWGGRGEWEESVRECVGRRRGKGKRNGSLFLSPIFPLAFCCWTYDELWHVLCLFTSAEGLPCYLDIAIFFGCFGSVFCTIIEYDIRQWQWWLVFSVSTKCPAVHNWVSINIFFCTFRCLTLENDLKHLLNFFTELLKRCFYTHLKWLLPISKLCPISVGSI